MKKSGRFPDWKSPLPNVRLFTSSQFSAINLSTTDLRATYPGVSNITINSPVSGGSSTSPALTILTLAIPSAGTWRLDAELRAYVPGAGFMAAAFYDNGTLIPGSEYFIAAGGVTQSGAATGQYGGFMSYNLTTTGHSCWNLPPYVAVN